MQMLKEQARIARESKNPKATLAMFAAHMDAMNSWYNLPDADPDSEFFDLDPETIFGTLMRFQGLKKATYIPISSKGTPLVDIGPSSSNRQN